MKEKQLVEISVAVYNQWSQTEKFLENLFSTISSYEKVAVNIIDNGSTDSTVLELDKYINRATIFYNDRNNGFAFAHNMIIRKSFSPFHCILHNDIVLTKNWLEKIIFYLETHEDIDIVGVINDINGLKHVGGRIEQDGHQENIYFDEKFDESKLDYVSSSCMIFRNKVVKKIGLFDERYVLGISSDIDYCVSAKDRGFKLGICRDVVIEHLKGKTSNAINANRHQETNRIHFVQRNKDWLEKTKGRALLRKKRRL